MNPLTVYLFLDRVSKGGEAIICVAEKSEIYPAIDRREIEGLFAGSILYKDDRRNKDYLGVWGARNASRLRRLLRERGFDLAIERKRPAGIRLGVIKKIYAQQIDSDRSARQ
jgi:hypothetical protein